MLWLCFSLGFSIHTRDSIIVKASIFNPFYDHYLRFDKYENKQLYWIEEELSAEWEKTSAKSYRQESEYQADVSASSVLESSLTPLEFGPAAGPGGG